jgi:hypothetical protein
LKKILRESYGVLILLFYFLKWPYIFGFLYLYFVKGLTENWVMNLFFVFSVALVIKDLVHVVRYGFRCTKDKGCNIEKDT